MSEFLRTHLLGHRLHYTELNEMYLSVSASALGMSLVAIFVPIYLYSLGYGIIVIAAFFIVMSLLRAALTPLAAVFMGRFGAKHLFALSQFFAMTYVCALVLADKGIGWVFLASVLSGVNMGCYWLAYHVNYSAVTSREKTSSQISIGLILLAAAHSLGPLVGGVIATQFGIEYGLIAAAVLLAASAWVMLQTPETVPRTKYKLSFLKTGWRPIRRDLAANFANNSQTPVITYTWPLFIFLFLGTYQSVGLLESLSLLAGVAAMFLVGKRGDNGKNYQQLDVGSKGYAIIHALRPLAQGFGGALGINIASSVFSNVCKIPFMCYFYHHASVANSRVDYVAKMELVGGIGQALSWVLVLLAGYFVSLRACLMIGFLYAAIMVLFDLQIAPRRQITPAISKPEETTA